MILLNEGHVRAVYTDLKNKNNSKSFDQRFCFAIQ